MFFDTLFVCTSIRYFDEAVKMKVKDWTGVVFCVKDGFQFTYKHITHINIYGRIYHCKNLLHYLKLGSF